MSGPLDHQITSARSGNGSDGTLWVVALTSVQAGRNSSISSVTYGVFRYVP